MDKKVYLSRFSKLARWRLPAGEAEEVINDYTELLDSHPEEGTALVKTLGDPEVAVKLLGITGEYACWMVVFGAVGLALLYFLAGILFNGGLDLSLFDMAQILYYLTVGLIAFWKWKSPKSKGRCPGLRPAMLGLLILAAMLAAVCGFIYYDCVNDFVISGDWIAPLLITVLVLAGCASFAAALTGMIRCRMYDHRWLIVSETAVMILFLCLQMTLLIRTLANGDAALLAMKYMMRYVIAGTVGVIWTLCC